MPHAPARAFLPRSQRRRLCARFVDLIAGARLRTPHDPHWQALSYLETNKIGRDDVFSLGKRFPRSFSALRKYVGFLALRRQIGMMSRIEKAMRAAEGVVKGRSAGLNAFFQDAHIKQRAALNNLERTPGLTADMRIHIKMTMKNASEPLARFFAHAVSAHGQKAGSTTFSKARAGCCRTGKTPSRDGGGEALTQCAHGMVCARSAVASLTDSRADEDARPAGWRVADELTSAG